MAIGLLFAMGSTDIFLSFHLPFDCFFSKHKLKILYSENTIYVSLDHSGL
jgi:hypothetical protein